jgi:hypothetical protein
MKRIKSGTLDGLGGVMAEEKLGDVKAGDPAKQQICNNRRKTCPWVD